MVTAAKTLLMLAVVGALGWDATTMLSTQFAVYQDAQDAAQAGHMAYKSSRDPQAAYAEVLRYADEHGDELVQSGYSTSKNNTVTVELRREAHTVIAHLLPFVKNYVVFDSTSTATDPW